MIRAPTGMAMPNSRQRPRKALMREVRVPIQRPRMRCRPCSACCSTDLTRTGRISDARAASSKAAASAAEVRQRPTCTALVPRPVTCLDSSASAPSGSPTGSNFKSTQAITHMSRCRRNSRRSSMACARSRHAVAPSPPLGSIVDMGRAGSSRPAFAGLRPAGHLSLQKAVSQTQWLTMSTNKRTLVVTGDNPWPILLLRARLAPICTA